MCQFSLKSVHSFSKYSVHNSVTDGQTDRRTDRLRTSCIASQDWRRHKIIYVRCVFVMLSIFCLQCSTSWGRDVQGGMGGEGRGRDRGEKGEGMEWREIGMQKK